MTAEELQREFDNYLARRGVTLTDGQRGIARALLVEAADHENVRVLITGAGTGKTFVMRMLTNFLNSGAVKHTGGTYRD